MGSTRSLARLLALACVFIVALACAADPPPPPPPPVILDTSLPPDGVPDVLAVLQPGGWLFKFDVDKSPDEWGLSSFHVRNFGGPGKPGELGGGSEGGGAGWTIYSVGAVDGKPKTVGFVQPPPPDGGTFGSFTFHVSGAGLPANAKDFEYRFDFNWQDDTGTWYNTEFLTNGTIVGGTTHSVPEPATGALIVGGLMVIGWYGAARRRSAVCG